MDEAARLREAWGGKPCPHPKLVKEYHLSMQTGDYACIQCGESFSRDERQRLDGDRTGRT